MKKFILILCLVFTTKLSFSTSVIFYSSEESIKKSNLIVEARVVDIEKSTKDYCHYIIIKVIDRVIGDCPEYIKLKRWGIDQYGGYKDTEFSPPYSLDDHFIICLYDHKDGKISTVGFYQGRFDVSKEYLSGTKTEVVKFKQTIKDIRNNKLSKIDVSLPPVNVEKTNPFLKKSGSGENKNEILNIGDHMGGAFNSYGIKWNGTLVSFKYNHYLAPSQLNTSTVAAAILDAFAIWNNNPLDELKFEYLGTTNAPLTKPNIADGINTIGWHDLGSTNYIAEVFPYPYPDFVNIMYYQDTDIGFNTALLDSFHFGLVQSARNPNRPDYITVLLHELGHVKGLGHTTLDNVTMYPYYNTCTAPLRQLTYGEYAGAIYHNLPNNVTVSNIDHLVVALTGGKTITLSNPITLTNGKWFELEESKATVNLNGHYIKSTGGTFKDAGGNTWLPNNIYIMQGADVKGHYSTLSQALNDWGSNQKLVVASGTHTITSLLTVPFGSELTIDNATITLTSGMTVNGSLTTNNVSLRFGYATSMVVNGSVNCAGTTFTGSCPDDDPLLKTTLPPGVYPYCWKGINVNPGSGEVTFNGCQISNGNYGVNVKSRHAVFEGIRVYKLAYGLEFTNYASGSISRSLFGFNNSYHITGDETSTPNAGDSYSYGDNSFKTAKWHQFFSLYPDSIYAVGNFWEGGPIIYGNVITQPTLSVDPYSIFNNIRDGHRAEIESGLFLKRIDEPIEKVHGIEELNQATRLLNSKKYDEALFEMRRLVDKYKDGFVGKRALVFIENILTETDRAEGILPMLEQYSNGKSKVAEFAHYRTGYQYLIKGEYDKAITIMKGTEFNNEDADLKQARLYDLGFIHYDHLNKKEEAYNYFDELVKTYPDCPLAETAIIFYNVSSYKYDKPIEDNKNETVITETKLFTNYPNPFNPSTVIKYQLSDASQVSLKVYDVMGREVATLVNSYQNKGSYDVTFNATGLSSGIYFYRLNAGGQQFINKMLLMK